MLFIIFNSDYSNERPHYLAVVLELFF